MRLLWIVPQPFYAARGTPMNVRRLAASVAAAGHDVDIVTTGLGEDVALPEHVRVVRAPRLPFLRKLPIGPSFAKVLSDVVLFVTVLGLLASDAAPSYAYLQGFEEGAWIAAVLGALYRVRFVYDMDSDMEEQSHDSARGFFRRLAPLVGWIDRWAIRRAAGVVTVCETLSAKVHRIAPEKPVFQIEDTPNVPAAFDRVAAWRSVHRRWSLPECPLVVYTGNLEHYQGVDLLVRAASHVLEQSADVVFLIVGGDERRIAELRRLAAAAPAEGRIVFTGQRPEAEMGELLAAADVLVSPRSLGSNTPLKLYTYLQSGTAVVATDRPVHTQVVSDTEVVLVPPTPEGMGEGILSLLRDPARRAEVGARGRALVERKYSEGAFAEKVRGFVGSLAANAPARIAGT
jgi:glycosyltransferase involved in cell wall biosynthesis